MRALARQRASPTPPCASACRTPGVGSWQYGTPHAPEPPLRLPPTTLSESASVRRANSANARSVGKSSACQPEPQAVSSCSSSVLGPLPGLQPTLPTTAAQLHAGSPKAHGELTRLGRIGLTVTLFLIGTGITRRTIREVGLRPLVQGLLLWFIVAAGSLMRSEEHTSELPS